MFGELMPISAGEPLPLLKESVRIGRRENCDIVLRFSDVSAHHAIMEIVEGYWFVRDLGSRCGVTVSGLRLLNDARKRVDPEDVIEFANHKFMIRYDPQELGAVGPPSRDDGPDSHFENDGARIPNGPKGHPPLREANEIPRDDDDDLTALPP